MALSGRPTALVLRALGLGDLLTGVPALRALVRALPDHEIVLAAPAELEPLVRLAGAAHRVAPTRGLEPPPWPGPGPELAANLHGRGPQSHEVLLRLRPRRLVAFGCPQLGVAGPAWRAEEHEVDRWCRLVSECGYAADPDDLRLPAPAVAPVVPEAVVVHPGAAYPARRWPPERFGAVAAWAAACGWPVLVTGNTAERGLAETVRRTARLPAESVVAGRTGLLELAALVAAARLVVCGDTGVAHLATAFGRPSVVLFGPTPPARWGPRGGGPHTVIWHGRGVGDPLGGTPDPALLQVGVAEVVRAAKATVPREPSSGPRTTPWCA